MPAGFDLQALRTGLATIFEKISGISDIRSTLTDRAVTETDRPWVMPDPSTEARLEFKLIAVKQLGGGDEVRTEYDPDLPMPDDISGPEGARVDGGFTVSVNGSRVLTFSVRVVCHDLEKSAFEYVERVRSNLQRPSILDQLSALDVSWNDSTDTRDQSYVLEGRAVSVAGFDLVLNITSNLDDDPVTTIETVHATGTAHV